MNEHGHDSTNAPDPAAAPQGAAVVMRRRGGTTPGRLIRDTRERAGLTQAQLAARCRPPVSHGAISDLEAGKTSMTLAWLDRLATALGVPLLVEATLGNDTFALITEEAWHGR